MLACSWEGWPSPNDAHKTSNRPRSGADTTPAAANRRWAIFGRN